MTDLKISEFDNGGAIQTTDEIAANRGGTNTKVFVGSAAAADIGAGPDDISTNSTLAENVADSFIGTATDSVSIGLGTKNFTTAPDKSFGVGRTLLVTSDADPDARRMTGIVSAYDDGTGALTLDVNGITGSGTYTDWTIRVAGDKGEPGANGVGTVETVNGIGPDSAYNVDLEAVNIPFVPNSSMVSTNVQDAIEEAFAAAGAGGGTDFIAGYMVGVAAQDYRIVVKVPYGGTITNTITRCVSGTATFTFKVNSTALGGTANSVSSSEQDQAHASSNTFAAGDDIVITASSVSSCVGASFTIVFNRT